MSAVSIAHAQFVESRRGYLGGTDIAAVVGVSPWASPLSVYMDKVQPQDAPERDSLPMRRGLALERFIAEEFVREHPEFVFYHPAPIVRTDWGFPAGASIDFMLAAVDKPRTPVALMDSKCAFGFRSSKLWSEADEDLPDHYFVQLQWYMAIAELPIGYGVADTGGDKLTVVEVHADELTQARLIQAGRDFWTRHVVASEPPKPTGHKADSEALAHMWPETIPDPPLEITDVETQNVLGDYLSHSFKAKEHAEKADAAKQKLQAVMGERETAIVGNMWRLSWKQQTRKTIDTKALRKELPQVADEYTRETTSRVFAQPKEITLD